MQANVANVESNTQNQREEIEKKGEKEAPVLSSNTDDQNTDVTDSEHLFQQQQRQQQQHVTSWKPPMIFNWGEYDGTIFTNHLEEVYDKIVYWRSNLFMLPTGNCGKQYI